MFAVRHYITLCVVCLLLVSCNKHKTETSFYFWKTRGGVDASEREAMHTLQANVLYTRLFDVDVDKESGQPIPVGTIRHLDSLAGWQIIPVVYITNRTMLGTRTDSVAGLAGHIYKKINTLMKGHSFHEFQIDCDWSDKSQEAYFQLLKTLKTLAGPEKQLSATIRLHQVKYKQRTGIPPVDKGMLMYYNMGNLHDPKETNSIYNPEDAGRYVSYAASYPMHLDVALPIFSWQVQQRDKKIIALLSGGQIPDESDTSRFAMQKKGELYTVKHSFLQDGLYFMEQDELRTERLSSDELLAAATQLSEHLNDDGQIRRIVFFDLNDFHISYYGTKTLEKTVAVFN
ncbi:MAG: hypothetical protein JST26_11085 [Bacteroidetes bacterium]|nr:hypothetical protein [Bacteroidota bacterium]